MFVAIARQFDTIDAAIEFRDLFLNERGLAAVGVRSVSLVYGRREVAVMLNPAKVSERIRNVLEEISAPVQP